MEVKVFCIISISLSKKSIEIVKQAGLMPAERYGTHQRGSNWTHALQKQILMWF
jgi:hypothetical protein